MISQIYILELMAVPLRSLCRIWLSSSRRCRTVAVFRYPDSVSIQHISALNLSKNKTDDSVRPKTEEEKNLYELLSSITKQPASLLCSRWREPSLSIHNLEVSGPGSMLAHFVSQHYTNCATFEPQMQPSSLQKSELSFPCA